MFVIVVIAISPFWPYSQDWGYAPSLGACSLGLILLVLRICRAI
ncbi:MAG TPA: DUF3309 family protein [Elusimicrobiota bacterium]|nr:DUF3309 family protein [Elusimicrobiota bacterium]